MTRWRRWRRPSSAALTGRCRVVLVTGAPGSRQDGARQRAAAGRHGPRRLVRGGQVRPVPARPRVRRGLSGVPRPGPAAAGGAGGRVGASFASGSWRRSVPTPGSTTAVVPEFAALLAVPPDPGDPLTAQVRAQRNAVELLRGDRHPRTPARRVRRRPAVGGPHAARSVRPRTERGADRRACCSSARTARVTWMWRIRSPPCCPEPMTRPRWSTCGWPTYPCRASSRWSPRRCTWTATPRPASSGRSSARRPATRTRRSSCSMPCAATGC